jgi:hypothetical protein
VVGQGSQEKIKMLQLVYKGRSGDNSIDIAFVGKGKEEQKRKKQKRKIWSFDDRRMKKETFVCF